VPAAGISVSGQNTANPSLRRGTPVWDGDQSGYDFDAALVPLNVGVPPSPTPDFVLGTFTHLNRPIYSPFLTSATLQVDTDITVGATHVGIISFLFDFTHHETLNGADPCANGEVNDQGANRYGCADIVTVTSNVASGSFSVGGVYYTINVAGFMADGKFVAEFKTKEKRSNGAQLMARLLATGAHQVPEPGSLAPLGMGLLALGLRSRFKSD
jgi:hypothetical protein